MSIHIVYSPGPREVREWQLDLPPGATVTDALHASGLQQLLAERPEGLVLGIWGRKARPQQRLRENDRVEVYRALLVDPKAARRERFVRQGARSAGLFAKKRAGAKAGY